jgi:hypothetical protein
MWTLALKHLLGFLSHRLVDDRIARLRTRVDAAISAQEARKHASEEKRDVLQELIGSATVGKKQIGSNRERSNDERDKFVLCATVYVHLFSSP